jgi:hypothetical protein
VCISVPSGPSSSYQKEIVRLCAQKMEDRQYLRNLVDSMPRRPKEVIVGEGGTNKQQNVIL